jgi:hypothetical protein
MTSNFQAMQSTGTSEDDETEARVRRALGLNSAPPANGRRHEAGPTSMRQNVDRPKSRFVRDGEVPVVVLHPRRDNELHTSDPKPALTSSATNRRDEAEIVLRGERRAREVAERRLSEALATIQDLQTKLGHAILSRDEALAGALRASHDREAAALALDAEQTARKKVAAPIAEKPPARAKSKPAKLTEPKPVKWWIKQKPTA